MCAARASPFGAASASSENSDNKKANKPYHGEATCIGSTAKRTACTKKAYYWQNNKALCGRHSDAKSRSALPKRSRADQAAIDDAEKQRRDSTVEQARLANVAAGRPGAVTLQRMLMMRNPTKHDDRVLVFPNYKHQNRKDGFGCKSLSPKSLGPVVHNQGAGLPPAKNLENFWQGSKLFEQEAEDVEEGDEDPTQSSPHTLAAGKRPSRLYYDNRAQFYDDDEPHRHKYKSTDGPNPNKPLCWIWTHADGTEQRFSYVEARQFYCTYYERMASTQDDFAALRAMIASGTNVEIVGYDARPLDYADANAVEAAYLDDTKPFGHELVLYTMLTKQQHEYPWRAHKTLDF